MDCDRIAPPDHLRILCPAEPVGAREPPPNYIWHADKPLYRIPGPLFDPATDSLAQEFAWYAITSQPVDYLRAAAHDFLRQFGARSGDCPHAGVGERYRFGSTPLAILDEVRIAGGTVVEDLRAYERGPAHTRVWRPAADVATWYQRVAVVPGPVLGGSLLVCLLGAVAAIGRLPAVSHGHPTTTADRPAATDRPALADQPAPTDQLAPSHRLALADRLGRSRRGLRLAGGVGLVLLAVPPLTAAFDYRYVPPALPFLGLGTAFAVDLVRGRRRQAGAPVDDEPLPTRPRSPLTASRVGE